MIIKVATVGERRKELISNLPYLMVTSLSLGQEAMRVPPQYVLRPLNSTPEHIERFSLAGMFDE